MKLIVFYVAEQAVELVKAAMFAAGAGCYEGFERCSWQTLGKGQYQAEGKSLSELNEVKVEIQCRPEVFDQAINALKLAHPCDEPAYYVLEI